jgi:hypothetical protein
MSDFGKYLIIMLTSFVTCVLLYEYLVRRFNVLRVLFGLKLPRREQAVAKVAMSISKS